MYGYIHSKLVPDSIYRSVFPIRLYSTQQGTSIATADYPTRFWENSYRFCFVAGSATL